MIPPSPLNPFKENKPLHMRPFTPLEVRNMEFLVQHNIDFTIVQLTATGLKKSIMDATQPMRSYFLEKDLHNYSQQLQGQKHKHLVKTTILTETNYKETQTSLYRPETKKGDPRLWIYGLQNFTRADDIHAICIANYEFYVINISQCNIENACSSKEGSFIKEFVNEIYDKKNLIFTEIYGIFQKFGNQWIETEVNADTGVGRTIETLLGIHQNARKTPDYKGVEIKSEREQRHSNKNVLFTQVPNWELSKLKSSKEIVEKYGYFREEDYKTYHNTVSCLRINSQGLGLDLEPLKEWLELKHYGSKIDDVVLWTLQLLHQRLLEKHKETVWVTVENKYTDGKEYFRFKELNHTKNPIVSQFDILLANGIITIDLLLGRKKHGDMYSFKIAKRGLPLLFPENEKFNLNDIV